MKKVKDSRNMVNKRKKMKNKNQKERMTFRLFLGLYIPALLCRH